MKHSFLKLSCAPNVETFAVGCVSSTHKACFYLHISLISLVDCKQFGGKEMELLIPALKAIPHNR